MQGVLLQGYKIKGGHLAEELGRRHLLTSVTNQHMMFLVCLPAMKSQGNFTGCQKCLAMGHHHFSSCMSPKQHHAHQPPARRFPEWVCGVSLHALYVHRYLFLYYFRSLMCALDECLPCGSSVLICMVGCVAFCPFHKFQAYHYLWAHGLWEFWPFSALDNLSWICNSNSSFHPRSKMGFCEIPVPLESDQGSKSK